MLLVTKKGVLNDQYDAHVHHGVCVYVYTYTYIYITDLAFWLQPGQ